MDDTISLDGDGTTTLHLPAAPIQELTVSVGGRPLTLDIDYGISKRTGVLRRLGGVWPDGLESVHIVYTHGWETIPGGIEDAVLEQASVQVSQLVHIQRQDAGPMSQTFGVQATVGVTQKWTDAVTKYSLGSGDRS